MMGLVACLAGVVSADQIFLIDVNDSQGTTASTTSGTWNNSVASVGGWDILNLVNTGGTASVYDMNMNPTAGGSSAGPSVTAGPGVFGEANTIYNDAFFNTVQYTIDFTSLNDAYTYNFEFFGSRDTTITRVTSYTIGGTSVNLQTSGTDLGGSGINHNVANTAIITGVSPVAGTITVAIDDVSGGFSYLNGIKVTEVIPEPATIGLFAVFGGGLLAARKKFRI